MTPLETEANPNIRVGPLRWGRPIIIRLNVHKLLLFVHIIYRLRQLSDDFQSGVRFALHSIKTVTNLSHVRM